jgi:predicted cupin superfamily sugar epimerase
LENTGPIDVDRDLPVPRDVQAPVLVDERQFDVGEVGRVGSDVAAGERPQGIVPADAWQCAESTGDWTLVGCTVAPGFEFAGFEMAKPDFEPAGA